MAITALLRRYATVAWCHRWKAIAFAWLVCVMGWAGLASIPDRFQATARISADADAVLSVLLRGIAIEGSPTRQVEMLQRTLLNRPHIDQIISETGLRHRVADENAREVLARSLAQDVRFTQPNRNLFNIEYRDTNPRVAYEVVQKTLDLFLEEVAASERQQMDTARLFLGEQIASYEQRLREAGRQRFEFQSRYQELLPGLSGAPSRFEQLRASVQQLRGELADAQSRRELTQRQLDAAPAMLVEGEGGVVGGPVNGVAEAERALRELRLRYTEQHPDVIIARKMVAELRASGGGRGPVARTISRRNPLHEQLRVRMVDADAQVAALERQLTDAMQELARLEALARDEADPQAQFVALERNYNVVRRNYEELLTRREALQIADAAQTAPERTKIEVVDPPEIPNVPVSPKRKLMAAAVLLGGLGAGAVLALALVRFDGGFYTVQDLRRLGLPVIGGISAAQTSPFVAARSILSVGLAAALLLLAFGAVLAGPSRLAKTTAWQTMATWQQGLTSWLR